MSFAPLHFRKMPIKTHGKFAILPMYIRAFALLLKQSCDDHGRIDLDGKTPASVITRLCAAAPNERRRIAGDIEELLRVGYLRHDDDAITVVEQESDWGQLDGARTSRATSTRSQQDASATPALRQHDASATPARRQQVANATAVGQQHDANTTAACSPNGATSRNDSPDVVALDEMRRDKSEEINEKRSSPTGEGVQGGGDSKQTTQEPKAPEPFALAHVAPEAPKAKSKAKPKAPEPEQRVITLLPTEQLAVDAIRNDPDLVRICKNVEQLAVDLVNCAPLIDVALEIRGLGAYLRTDKGRKKRYTDGNGYLLNNIGRKQTEQAERQASMVQYAKPPPRPIPPPPPMHPNVAEESRKAGELMRLNPHLSLRELFGNVGRPFPSTDDEPADADNDLVNA